MRKNLEDFYYGNIAPCERQMAPNSELKQAADRVARCEQQLSERLGKPEQVFLNELVSAQHIADGITADRYRLMIETYTIPRIGKIKLKKLTSRDLQKMYKNLMEHGRVNQRSGHGNPGLSSTTVRSVHLMLHSAFEKAAKERLIPRNPTDDCIAPKVQKVEMKTLRPEHLKSYRDAADARGVLPMFYLELVSGLRKGKLAALLWDDLDIQNRTISVSKQYIKNPSGKLTLSRSKTETSVCRVSIPQEAVDLLIQEHEKHPENSYMFPSSTTGGDHGRDHSAGGTGENYQAALSRWEMRMAVHWNRNNTVDISAAIRACT